MIDVIKIHLRSIIYPLFFSLALLFLDIVCVFCWVDKFYSAHDYFCYNEIISGIIIDQDVKKLKNKYTINITNNGNNKNIYILSDKKYAKDSIIEIRCASKDRYYFNNDSIYSVVINILILFVLSLLIIFLSFLSISLFIAFITSLLAALISIF